MVAGELVSNAGLITLSATSPDLVTRTLVHQQLTRGQLLVELDQPLDSTTLGNTHAIILAQLQAQRTGLEADLLSQRQLAASRHQDLCERIASLTAQQAEIEDLTSLLVAAAPCTSLAGASTAQRTGVGLLTYSANCRLNCNKLAVHV